ncbi:MAG: family 10 glycosylhydrolase [Verrucomicrobiota bacterium]
MQSTLKPPQPPAREFRAAWVASVNNIDWPSKPGLPTDQQKSELISILDRAAKLHLNAIILQVRPSCDALYASRLEPWSEYLTGQMGKAPEPWYDPLAFAVAEAHARGLELHAWFNPFRARHPSAKQPPNSEHISKTKKQMVRTYGKHLWLDPSEKAARDYSIKVILDVIKRYDVDGVHLDDYFYPYKEKDAAGRTLDFPDDANWKKYAAKGTLSREDWRREQVNLFVQQTYKAIKDEKPWVKFGISPFGIWRSGQPEQIKGYDAYENLYADSRKWLMNGWLDYFAPQLYWSIEAKEQSYPVLLKWWRDQNPKGRYIWPGNNTVKVATNWKSEEILRQIQLTRIPGEATGNIHWSIKPLLENSGDIGNALLRGPYAETALIPAYPWLGQNFPAKPKMHQNADTAAGTLTLSWDAGSRSKLGWWVVQTKRNNAWSWYVFPPDKQSATMSADKIYPDVFALYAMDRYGNLSTPTVLELR